VLEGIGKRLQKSDFHLLIPTLYEDRPLWLLSCKVRVSAIHGKTVFESFIWVINSLYLRTLFGSSSSIIGIANCQTFKISEDAIQVDKDRKVPRYAYIPVASLG
jgi:hypothetical protein